MLKYCASALILASLASAAQADRIQCPDIDLSIVENDRAVTRALRSGDIPPNMIVENEWDPDAIESGAAQQDIEELFCDTLKTDTSHTGQHGMQNEDPL